MAELAEIYELLGRAGSYAALRFSTDTADPASGALLQRCRSARREIETTLLFFELEWAALRDERAEELLGGRGPRLLPPPPAQRAPLPRAPAHEPEEKILAEKSLTGAGAWSRLFEELTSAIEVDLPARRASHDREPVALDVALSV